jgi:hypothetical protein
VASSGRWGVHQRSACVDMTAIPFFLLRLSAELIAWLYGGSQTKNFDI